MLFLAASCGFACFFPRLRVLLCAALCASLCGFVCFCVRLHALLCAAACASLCGFVCFFVRLCVLLCASSCASLCASSCGFTCFFVRLRVLLGATLCASLCSFKLAVERHKPSVRREKGVTMVFAMTMCFESDMIAYRFRKFTKIDFQNLNNPKSPRNFIKSNAQSGNNSQYVE